jgi:DNA-binding NarL/FixJ family response regulator
VASTLFMTPPADLNAAVQITSSSDSKKIRVLVADDHQPILDRVAALLSEDFTVVATVNAGDAAVGAARHLRPDVLVLDISMPGLNGFEAASQVKEAGSTAAVIFLSVHDEPEFLEAAWKSGALGYVRKSHLGSDLIPAIRAALDGRRFVSASIDQRGLS